MGYSPAQYNAVHAVVPNSMFALVQHPMRRSIADVQCRAAIPNTVAGSVTDEPVQ